MAPPPVAHPLLTPRQITDETTLKLLRDQRPFDHTIIALVQQLAQERRDHPRGASRLLHGAFPDAVSDHLEQSIRGAILEAHTTIQRQLMEWLPEEYVRRIHVNTELRAPPESLNELLAIVYPTTKREADFRKSFEARRLLHLAMLLFRIRHGSHHADPQGESVFGKSMSVLPRVQELFQTQFLTRLPEDRTMYANCTVMEGNPEGRCLDVSFTEKPEWQTMQLTVSGFRDTSGQREHDILTTYRVKTPFSIILHMLRDNIPYPEWVMDIRGIRLVVWSHEARIACFEALARHFPRLAWSTAGWNDRYSKTIQRALNRFSGSYFRAMKLYAEIDDGSGPWEFQIMHIRDYVNLWYSRGEENWYRYRLRQLLTLFFPLFFPTVLYQIPWSGDTIRSACHRHISKMKRGTIAQ